MALTWGGSRCRIKAPGSLVFPLVTAAGDLHHCQGLTADVTFSPPSTGANVRSKGKPFAYVFLSWQKVVSTTGWLYVGRQSAMVSAPISVTSHCTLGGME